MLNIEEIEKLEKTMPCYIKQVKGNQTLCPEDEEVSEPETGQTDPER